MAVSYLNRLNTLFYLADDAAMNLDVNSWMHSIMTIFRELSTEMKETEINELETDLQKINSQVQKHNQDHDRTGRATVTSELYHDLHKAEIKLRRVLKDSGLQMKMKQDAESAIENL